MTSRKNTEVSVAEMIAGIEAQLARFEAANGGLHPKDLDRGYWARKAHTAEMLIAFINLRGGRASGKSDAARISFAGITTTCTAGLIQCARSWCRKAREKTGAAA
jgi:hypothetical protein